MVEYVHINEIVSKFETNKASSSITTRHEKLESLQHKIKETEVIIYEGIPIKRTLQQFEIGCNIWHNLE